MSIFLAYHNKKISITKLAEIGGAGGEETKELGVFQTHPIWMFLTLWA